jgi:hypothetical protein
MTEDDDDGLDCLFDVFEVEGFSPDKPLTRQQGETDIDLYMRAAHHASIYGRTFVRLPVDGDAYVTGIYGCACSAPCEHEIARVAELGYN